jgi:hypothetical protein
MSSWSATTLAQEPKGTPRKENTIWPYLLLEFVKIIPTSFAQVAAFHMSQYHVAIQVTTIKMASCWTFPFKASFVLPHSPCMSTKLLPTKTSNSQPLESTIHEQAYSLQSLHKLAHALNHLNKNEFVRSHSFSSHLLEKLHHLPKLPNIHVFCNLLFPCKNVQLHNT